MQAAQSAYYEQNFVSLRNVKIMRLWVMIQHANPEDAQALHILLKQLGSSKELTQVEEALSKNNNDTSSAVYVYDLKQKIVGFVSIIRFFYFPAMQNIMRITAICVDEQHRNIGIGNELLNFVENLASNCNDISIEITCSMQRQQAHSFYLKRGYYEHSYKFIKHLIN